MMQHSLALVAAAVLLLSGAPGFGAGYSFALDGRPVDAHVLPVTGARKGAPAPGDIATVAGFPFVLQQPGHYEFRPATDQSVLHASIDGGAFRPVAVRIPAPGSGLPNLLDSLSDSERSELWGLLFENQRGLDSRALAGIDWERTLFAWRGALPEDPPLPASLCYLELQPTSVREASPMSLPPLTALRYLNLELPAGGDFDARSLAPARQLRNLSITGGTLLNPAALSTLPDLRFVKLRGLRGLSSIEFASHLSHLRVLKIDETEVTDLRPVGGLHELRLLSANATPAASLPPLESLPELRDLRLHSTPLAGNSQLINPLRSKVNVLIKNWEPSIRAFEARDRKSPPPANAYLFVGSSTIRIWDLAEAFPGRPTINRGFGGSELSDALRYFDRIVQPYAPRAILLYAGDNDIDKGETPDQILADYQAFFGKVRTYLPGTHLAFFPIKPSLKRWDKWPLMMEVNETIRKGCEPDPLLHYLDTATPMLGEDGRPRPELFDDDGLHLSPAGYEVWNTVVRNWMDHLPDRAKGAGK